MDYTTKYGIALAEGMRVRANWGAYYPYNYGVIIGFDERPASEFFPAQSYALIEWEPSEEDDLHTSRHEVDDIRPHDWRIGDGGSRSPIGIYLEK